MRPAPMVPPPPDGSDVALLAASEIGASSSNT
jgi:hypothetical protein